ncbi:MAG: outer membrane protein [Janthinobacterium lividum]
MRSLTMVVLLSALTTPGTHAQVRYDASPYVPRVTVAGGYQYLRANAPPAACNCFSTNGGFVSAGYTFRYWLRGVAEVTGSHGNNIGPLGQNLTLLTYTAGPQVVLHTRRFEPFAQALFGAAHGSDSYFPSATTYSTSATSFAYQMGGGIDYNLSHRFSVRAIEAQYLHTGFPNGTNSSQNHLMLGAGIVWKLHGSLWSPNPGHRKRL